MSKEHERAIFRELLVQGHYRIKWDAAVELLDENTALKALIRELTEELIQLEPGYKQIRWRCKVCLNSATLLNTIPHADDCPVKRGLALVTD